MNCLSLGWNHCWFTCFHLHASHWRTHVQETWTLHILALKFLLERTCAASSKLMLGSSSEGVTWTAFYIHTILSTAINLFCKWQFWKLDLLLELNVPFHVADKQLPVGHYFHYSGDETMWRFWRLALHIPIFSCSSYWLWLLLNLAPALAFSSLRSALLAFSSLSSSHLQDLFLLHLWTQNFCSLWIWALINCCCNILQPFSW
jgi:hypothetical protein